MGVSAQPPPISSQQHPVTPQPRSNLVKHPLQNIENDFHQWLSDSFRVYLFRFRLGLGPGPRWGSLQRCLRPLTGLRGP